MLQIFRQESGFYRRLWSLMFPIVLQNIISISLSFADTFMVGLLGNAEMAAVSAANTPLNVVYMAIFGFQNGMAVLVSQYWGQHDTKNISRCFGVAVYAITALASLVALACLCFPSEIMGLITPNPALIAPGIRYIRLAGLSCLFNSISSIYASLQRSTEDPTFGMALFTTSMVINTGLNYILIFGKLGFPEMQIAGAALATVISRIIEAAIILVFLLKVDTRIGLKLRHLVGRCSDMLKPYLRYSVPVIISDFLLGLGNTAVSIVIGHLGASFVSANAIVSQTVRLSTVMNQGISNAGGVMTGNTLGRGETEKAYRQGVTFLMLSLLMGILAAIIILAVCPPVINAYNITQETKDIAFQLMYSVSVMVIFQATQSMLTKGVLRNGGDTRFLMVADIAFMWLASIPLGYLAGYVWYLSPFWIYALLKIDYIIKTVWCTIRLKRRTWIHGFAQKEQAEA